MTTIITFLSSFLGVLTELIIPLLAYFQGKRSEHLETVENQLKKELKDNVVEESNLIKSDTTILNELRNRDTRK